MRTSVKYEPRREIIIHEYTKYDSPEEFIKSSARGLPAGSVLTAHRWVNGILLSFRALPINEITTKELIEGKLHWDHVSFVPMPEYRDQIITEGGVTVLIGNVSKNPVFAAIAQFIKENLLQSE